MKAIMVMFDSLNKNMLSSYGCDWTHTPNFKRLFDKTVAFDNSYVGSLPCMPARRELHTGRFNFLHRSWGPIEPFDDSMPQILKRNGVISHLISDHQHYWEDGGATYHNRYSSWEIVRGQEGDPWKCEIGHNYEDNTAFKNANIPLFNAMKRQDAVNRKYIDIEEKMPQAITFKNGIDFIDKNNKEDNWFLQIETFDPHEPFFSMEQYKKLYKTKYEGKSCEWPPYYFVQEDDDVLENTKLEYAALLSMCDEYLGKVLDKMDEYNMWDDTMLIVNTDHGYLLGEHGWWSKTVMPVYNEIANTPLFIWDPRAKISGERRQALVQTVDIAPTLLDFFNVTIPVDMEGKALKDTIVNDTPIRKYAVFGHHGAQFNCTDGEYLYMHSPVNRGVENLYEYTLMPTHMRERFSVEELQNIELQEPFKFTKGCRTMRIKANDGMVDYYNYGDKLFDIKNDPGQLNELDNIDVELKMLNYIREFMISNDAPDEQYKIYGLSKEKCITKEELEVKREMVDNIDVLNNYKLDKRCKNAIHALLSLAPKNEIKNIKKSLEEFMAKNDVEIVGIQHIIDFICFNFEGELKDMNLYFVKLASRTN